MSKLEEFLKEVEVQKKAAAPSKEDFEAAKKYVARKAAKKAAKAKKDQPEVEAEPEKKEESKGIFKKLLGKKE